MDDILLAPITAMLVQARLNSTLVNHLPYREIREIRGKEFFRQNLLNRPRGKRTAN